MTRRFFNTLLDASHAIVKCSLSPLCTDKSQGTLIQQLLDMLRFYADFEINDFTGEELTESDTTARHYQQIQSLQRTAFQHYPDLREFALSSAGTIDNRESLAKYFEELEYVLLWPTLVAKRF